MVMSSVSPFSSSHEGPGRKMLSDQFVRLYRGVRADPTDVNTKALGQHWSADRSVAERFASFDEDGDFTGGTVVEGAVHRRNLISRGSTESLRVPGMLNYVAEKEHPVRPGSTVHILSATSLGADDDAPADLPSVGKRRTGRA